ncbi:MAG: hypothetical protein ACREOO_22655 [bacterium]
MYVSRKDFPGSRSTTAVLVPYLSGFKLNHQNPVCVRRRGCRRTQLGLNRDWELRGRAGIFRRALLCLVRAIITADVASAKVLAECAVAHKDDAVDAGMFLRCWSAPTHTATVVTHIAMDADHVIAVTTIVSRQRSVRSAALIGMLWGIGHTLTILLVGGGRIIFRIVISTRAGLTLELVVALMLIILGFLNLRGIMRWINETFGSRQESESELEHVHPHRHGDYVHSHVHRHNPEGNGHGEEATPQGWLDRTFGELKFY